MEDRKLRKELQVSSADLFQLTCSFGSCCRTIMGNFLILASSMLDARQTKVHGFDEASRIL